MSEYISKQMAIRAFAEYEKKTTPSWSGVYKETLEEWIDELTKMLSDVPTIDIVYCKECEYHDSHGCHKWRKYPPPEPANNAFCSYGERKK